MPTVVITGGSSGIGLACCELFLEKGFKVYEISRKDGGSSGAIHVRGDVTDESSVKNAFSEIIEKEGAIDVLVNNAGFGISGPVELTGLEDAKRQLDVNFFGTFLCAREAAKYMRAQQKGRIVNVSSVAAIAAIPFQCFYSASKAAINSLTLALANELRPFGIKVCAVMPGDVKTGFTAARVKGGGGEAYGKTLERSVKTMEHDETNGMSPRKIAECVYKAATQKNPRPLRTKGAQYHAVAALLKLLPARTSNWIISKMYT